MAARGGSHAAELLHEGPGEQKAEPHRQAEQGWQPELDHFMQNLGSSRNRSNVCGGEVASPGVDCVTGGFPTDGVSCPAAPCCRDEGQSRYDRRWDRGLGTGGVSCRQGLRWSFKMALCSWRNVKQLAGRARSTALSR